MDAHAAGFRLGPRINAAGRLQRADAALELLLTDDEERAEEVARELDLLNRDRRETEQRILHAAEAACADQMSAAAIVVAGEGWHPGVVGIVASRLVERHRRPCVVIAPGRGLRAAARAAASPRTTFTPAWARRPPTSPASAATGWRPAWRSTRRRSRPSAPRWPRTPGERLSPEDLQRVQPVDAVVPGGALNLDLAEELRAPRARSARPTPRRC